MNLSVSSELLDPITPKVTTGRLNLWHKRTANIFRGVIEMQTQSAIGIYTTSPPKKLTSGSFLGGEVV
jgi:hypothetical protein